MGGPLNAPKVADGLQALKWWKEGRILEIAEYCCFDVKITKELHEYGRDRGEVLSQMLELFADRELRGNGGGASA